MSRQNDVKVSQALQAIVNDELNKLSSFVLGKGQPHKDNYNMIVSTHTINDQVDVVCNAIDAMKSCAKMFKIKI
jgi:hypothetical protein